MVSASADDAGMLNVVQSIKADHFKPLTTRESFQSRAFTAGLSKTGSDDYAEAVVEATQDRLPVYDAGDRRFSAAISSQLSLLVAL